MATRLYLPASAASTPIAPTPDAAWENTSILARAMTSTSPISDAMTTVSFAEGMNTANEDILFRQHVSAELAPGQTITGSQALKAQVRVMEPTTLNHNLFLAVGIRVINGTTVQKTVLAVTRDNVEANLDTLENRQFTATSAATNYTTVAGDRLVIETGMGGTPGIASDHDSSMRFGDAAASDLPENDTATTDDRPWLELTDTLTFTSINAAASLTGTGTVAAAAQMLRNAAASLTGTGTLAADADIIRNAAASLTGTATLAAVAKVTHNATASLTSSATLDSVAQIARNGAASLTGTATLDAAPVAIYGAAAALAGTATVYAYPTAIYQATGSLTGTAAVDALADVLRNGAASLQGAATLDAFAAVVLSAIASLTGTATIAPYGTAIYGAVASLTGTSAFGSTAQVIYKATSVLQGTATISAVASVTHNASAALFGIATISATPSEVTHNAVIVLQGTATISPAATITHLAVTHPSTDHFHHHPGQTFTVLRESSDAVVIHHHPAGIVDETSTTDPHSATHGAGGADALLHDNLPGGGADSHHAQDHGSRHSIGGIDPISGLTSPDYAPKSADYLVGTADSGLPGEIVVGPVPGGELGGTWAAPTIDATHSGSAHHAQSHAHDGVDGSGTAGHGALTGITADQHHAISHQLRHQTGQADALAGSIDANARLQILKGGANIGLRRKLNFIQGANTSASVLDNPGNESVDVTIDAIVPTNHAQMAGIGPDDHHERAHTHASHTNIGVNDHHAESHPHQTHTNIGVNDHHNQNHQTSHQAGQADAIQGTINANAWVNIYLNGANHGLFHAINFLAGGGVTLTRTGGNPDIFELIISSP